MKPESLAVHDLRVCYHTSQGPVKAVDGVSFTLTAGERFGLVGESGSGKSTVALALLRLIKPPGRIEAGQMILNGTDLVSLSTEEMRRARLSQISLIPQGAMNSLNPVMKLKHQMIDGMKAHNRGMSGRALEERVTELLEWVGLSQDVANLYPHELSGGMKQRVAIAIAVSLQPRVIVADEPTSALDVVVQRQVLETMRRVQEELSASVLLLGHDMGIMAHFTERLGVMYAGRLVEIGRVREIFKEPLQPYTQMLIASLPSLEAKGFFRSIPGITPSLLDPPPGCVFNPRCPHTVDRCRHEVPQLIEVRPGRWVACHLVEADE